ncbi:HpcH/HpaI aldolase family protein [Nonomuraea zeae]|uniref:Aldolase n=1 Tax=Nonomuraea zeae TaxID=1642303 RepID=A0A5S4GE72_9ACTN|nr:aldolase/citrate lyase family protein [Nonomuraea zeae]TMR31159.1 aldolase [Nonomuraea zeae]
MTAAELAARIRNRERCLGYWVVLDAPVATERLARLGYDYVALDGQHGLIGTAGLLANLMAVDAGGRSAGLVRVESADPAVIGRALDFGAAGVIVPLVDSAADAARAVSAARYPGKGRRSYGPMRSMLRIGPTPAEADESVLVLAMIETPDGLADIEAICATPGLDGVYVGPSDLCLAVGGRFPNDPEVADVFEAALEKIRTTARDAGIAAGIHNPTGEEAARRLAEGFTFATVASDLVHLEQAAAAHLEAARGDT